MALTKVSRGLLSTGIVDNSNATAITLNADESATFAGSVTSGAHLINAVSSAFGASSVQGFNTDFLVDTGQGYSRHNSYHTGGSNHQFLVNEAGSTTNAVALSIAKDKTVTFGGNVGANTSAVRATMHIKAADNNWESGLLIENNSGNKGWNFHPETNGELLIGYNAATNASLTDQTASVALAILPSGRLGLGLTNPSATLDISAPTNTTPLEINVATDNSGYVTHRNAAGTDIAYYGVGAAVITGGGANDFGIRAQSGHLLLSAGGSTERLSIDPSGNMGYGNRYDTGLNNTGFYLNSTGLNMYQVQAGTASSTYHVYDTNANAFKFYVGYTGTIHATSGSIALISDARLKENIRDLDDGLAKILALKPRKFDWKEGKGADIKDVRGFVAQEFEEVFPDLIDRWLDEPPEGEEPYKAVRADLIPTLVKAIQEQQVTITALTARVAQLEQN